MVIMNRLRGGARVLGCSKLALCEGKRKNNRFKKGKGIRSQEVINRFGGKCARDDCENKKQKKSKERRGWSRSKQETQCC